MIYFFKLLLKDKRKIRLFYHPEFISGSNNINTRFRNNPETNSGLKVHRNDNTRIGLPELYLQRISKPPVFLSRICEEPKLPARHSELLLRRVSFLVFHLGIIVKVEILHFIQNDEGRALLLRQRFFTSFRMTKGGVQNNRKIGDSETSPA